MIIGISLTALILLIWFRTDAYLEYCRVLRLNCISFYKDYDVKHNDDVSLTYLFYLRLYHNCFFIRLITCPICLAVWIGMLLSLYTYFVYFPIYTIGGLLLYTIIDRLLG